MNLINSCVPVQVIKHSGSSGNIFYLIDEHVKAAGEGNFCCLYPFSGFSLKVSRNLGETGNSEIDDWLKGDWQNFLADIGDDKLLFDCYLITASAVVRPESDICGISKLALKITGVKATDKAEVCAG